MKSLTSELLLDSGTHLDAKGYYTLDSAVAGY
jgi:hypothetical protein